LLACAASTILGVVLLATVLAPLTAPVTAAIVRPSAAHGDVTARRRPFPQRMFG
jgi:hypothetical protein